MMVSWQIDAILSFKAACLRCKLNTLLHTQTNPLWTMNSARIVVNSTIHFDDESYGTIQFLKLLQQVFIVKMQGNACSSHHDRELQFASPVGTTQCGFGLLKHTLTRMKKHAKHCRGSSACAAPPHAPL